MLIITIETKIDMAKTGKIILKIEIFTEKHLKSLLNCVKII